jgi:hypothetical protein
MGDRQVKDLRKQLKNVVEGLLPEVMQSVVVDAIMDDVGRRLKSIEENVKKIMHEMNERQKDTMSYLVRQTTTVTTDKPTKLD